MKPNNLLSQLADLEDALNNFSFEELTTADAKRLKTSFDSFKNQLERKVFGQESDPDNLQDIVTSKDSETEREYRQEMLIATVSHEIRTPLSGIIGFTDLLRETNLNKDQKEQVNAISAASNNLMGIINELLEYSKILAGLEQFERIDFSFAEVVGNVVNLCKTLLQGKEIKFQVDLDPQIPEFLKGDPSKLSQVLLNLLGNSIKFVEKGNISMNISLIKERNDQVWLEFVVSDTGIGISEDELKHIFDSFKQANQHTFSKYGGTGLGLNIVKQIVEKLKGELEVSSRLGIGTTFRFTLAYGKGDPLKFATTTDKNISPREVEGMHVLVFEDNLLNQRLIEQRLKAWGVHAYITEDAYYGLDLLEKSNIDMVLMDLRMPVMNGFEVTRRIRNSKLDRLQNIPIIALTADFTVEDQHECDNNGINDYIIKPYSPEVLLAKMIRNKKGATSSHNKQQDSAIIQPVADRDVTDVDLKQALEDCMGDMGVLRELVLLYKQNAMEFIGKVKVYMDQEDFGKIRDSAHKIKCGLAMMKTHSLYLIVEQIHNNCRTTRDLEHLRHLYNCFLQKYQDVEKAIDNELEDLEIKGF
ncbi:MAG: ATP-binding protein [Flavobacteriaceae bacterium]